MRLVAERPDLDRYLEDTEWIDWQTPAVAEAARGRAAGAGEERAQIRALFEFVRDEVAHSLDAGRAELTCRASHVLREGHGLCFAKSHLLAALLRARGIPAGFGYQRLRRDPPARGFVLHGFVGVYLADEARWAALDPRGDREGVRTVCDLDAPSLAFAPDADADEKTYSSILARPHPRVVDVLSRAPDLERALAHLPGEL